MLHAKMQFLGKASLPLSHMNQPRSSLSITLSVWRALLLRESLSRLFSRRAAWVWLLLEPVAHMAFMVFIFTVIRVRQVGGIETGLWLIIGFLGFFFFRRTGNQSANAIGSNRSLFAYRQVKPVDTVLMRAALEGFLMLVVSLLVLMGGALLGLHVLPSAPLAVMEAVFGLWLLGLGFGLVVSVIKELTPELDNLLDMVMMPMMMISGVIFPLSALHYPYREWLMYNPVAHGLEAARLGFAPYYHAAPELSLPYLYSCALVLLFFGLALHARFAKRLMTK
jgi:capsular polysaccharide transport system permease protein